jgi:hypothetical protein
MKLVPTSSDSHSCLAETSIEIKLFEPPATSSCDGAAGCCCSPVAWGQILKNDEMDVCAKLFISVSKVHPDAPR